MQKETQKLTVGIRTSESHHVVMRELLQYFNFLLFLRPNLISTKSSLPSEHMTSNNCLVDLAGRSTPKAPTLYQRRAFVKEEVHMGSSPGPVFYDRLERPNGSRIGGYTT
jgi:hypothetical protein